MAFPLPTQLTSELGIQGSSQPGPNQPLYVSLPFSCYPLLRFQLYQLHSCAHPLVQVDPPPKLPLCPLWKSTRFIKAHLRHRCLHKAFPRSLTACHGRLSESSWALHSVLLGHFSYSSGYYSYPEIFLKIFTRSRGPGRQGLCLPS